MTKSEEVAMKEYHNGSEEQKSLLEKVFGKEFFHKDEWKKFSSYEEVCKVFPPDPEMAHILSYEGTHPKLVAARVREELEHIVKAINGDDVIDFSNRNQKKFYVVMEFEESSGRWVSYYYYHYFQFTFVGSRLAISTDEKADFIGKTFGDKYDIIFQQ